MSKSISIATAADIPLIRELMYAVWPQTYTPIIGEGQVAYMIAQFYSPEALAEQMNERGNTFFIASFDNVPVGFASIGLLDPQTVKLHKLYVVPQVQGKGMGRYMLNHIMSHAKTQGITQLQLNVNIYNKNAIDFYTRLGFFHLKSEDIDIGNGYYMNDHVLAIGI